MEAADALRELSKPKPDGDRVKRAIERAAEAAGLKYWRAYDIWYRKARRIEENEADSIARALEKKNAMDARYELMELRSRLNRLEALLSAADPDVHRETVTVVRSPLRRRR
jgi:hypothetical protein